MRYFPLDAFPCSEYLSCTMNEEVIATPKKPQLHFSALEQLWKCGVAFERRYILKDRGVAPSYVHVGKAVDHGANINLQNKIDKDVLLPVEQVVDEARDSAAGSMEEEGLQLEPEDKLIGEKAAKAKVIDKTVRLARAHAAVLAPRLKPKRVQAKWALEIPGMPFDLVGTRDLDEIDETVSDLKTSKRSPQKNQAVISDQLTTYAFSVAVINNVQPPVKVALDYIVDLKGGAKVADRLTSTRSKPDFEVLLRRIENAKMILEKGAFTPANQGRDWWCSLQYCEFATTCPYFRMSLAEPEGD
jgi:hypothetical protein